MTGKRHADRGYYGPVVLVQRGKRLVKHLVIAELEKRGLLPAPATDDATERFARQLADSIFENFAVAPDDARFALTRLIALLEEYRQKNPPAEPPKLHHGRAGNDPPTTKL